MVVPQEEARMLRSENPQPVQMASKANTNSGKQGAHV